MTASRRDIWAMILASGVLASLFVLSFVATPVKFLAPDVPLTHLLAVGRVTFRASLAIEVVFLIGLLLMARGRVRWIVFGAAIILTFQWLIVMPRLDERTLARIGGAEVAPSSLHHWWIGLDVVRLALYGILLAALQNRFVSRHANDGQVVDPGASGLDTTG